MKLLRKILILCVLIGGASVFAAAPKEPAKVSAATKESMARDAVCTACHSDTKPMLAFYQTRHGVRGDSRTPTCQACHGESTKHINGDQSKVSPDVIFKKGTFAVSDAKAQNASCTACHEKDASRHNWTGSAHDVAKVKCVSCHSIHDAHDKVRDRKTQTEVCFTCHKEQRAQAQKISHHPTTEGKVTCSDCHNVHGSAGPKLLKEATVNDTCYTCHAEKRGPFLWEHQPVVENCSNCHSVHGSNISPLLKSRAPFLCQQCHNGPHSSADPVGKNAAGKLGGLTGTGNAEKVGRACMNCHSMVHGSNSPAGALLHR